MSAGASTGPPRLGEALDTDAVTGWLRGIGLDVSGAPVVTQYTGGASNWTYRLEYPGHDLVLRRPPAGRKAKSAHDMGREFRIQQALRPTFGRVPEMVSHCADDSLLGTEFYVMRRVEGWIPRAEFPADHRPDAAEARRLNELWVDELVALHRVDVDAAGLAPLGKGPGYPRRQVEGWIERYGQARTWNVPRWTGVTRWLTERTPADAGVALIHNDWRLDNCVFSNEAPSRIVAVLDWELATVGDPLMELGSALAYWVQADDNRLLRAFRRQPSHVPGMMTRREIVARYLEATGRGDVDWAFYEVFGLFRLAGIAQQIYWRYHHGQSRNRAFAPFWIAVHALHHQAKKQMRRAG
jgi:aminoglycoside phosphotransferase (APT) family kinase protein